MTGVEVSKARGSTPVDDLGLPARGFITGNPTNIEIQDRADVSADQVVAAAKEALERKFGPEPCSLDFQATAFVGRKP